MNFAGIIYFAKDIYIRQNPKVLQYETIENDPPGKNITARDFSFVLALGNPYTYEAYRNSSVYYVDFYNYKLRNGSLVHSRKLKSGPCSRKNFKGVNMSIFDNNFPFENYHCIDKSENIELKGVLSGKDISYINIKIRKCKENCVSDEELKNLLSGAPMYFYYVDKYFDASNFKNPTKFYFNQYFNSAQNFYKLLDVTIKRLNFIDDVGVLFEDKKTSSELVVDKIDMVIDNRNVGDFFEIVVHLSQRVSNVTRNYLRLQQVIANVGGLLHSLFLISQVIVNFFTREMYFSHCYTKLYVANTLEKNNNSVNEISQVYLRSNNELNAKHTTTHIKIPRNYLLEIKGSHKKNSQLNKSGNNLLMESDGRKLLKSLFNFEYLFKVFKEVECLKRIILSPKQLKLFEQHISMNESSRVLISTNNVKKDKTNFSLRIDNFDESDAIDKRMKKLLEYTTVS